MLYAPVRGAMNIKGIPPRAAGKDELFPNYDEHE